MQRKNLVCSLVLPVLTIIGGAAGAVLWQLWPSVIIMVSGLLAVLLTAGLCIDTSRYFGIRSLFFGLSLLTFVLPIVLFNCFSGDGERALFSYFLLIFFCVAPLIAFLAEIIWIVRLPSENKPRAVAVILLSDLLFWDLIALAWSLISLCITGF